MPDLKPYSGPERRDTYHCSDHCHMIEHVDTVTEVLSGLSGGIRVLKWIAGAGIPVIVGLSAWTLTTIYESNGELRELKIRVNTMEQRLNAVEISNRDQPLHLLRPSH